jgi:transposase
MDAPRDVVYPFEVPQRPYAGGAALEFASRAAIVHMYSNLGMEVEDIAPFIPTPRVSATGHITVQTVRAVLRRWEEDGNVEDRGRKTREREMDKSHVDVLLEIVTKNPWLYLDEIADSLYERCKVRYQPQYCWKVLHAEGFSRKKMQRVAQQRDEEKRHLFFLRLSEILTDRSQLVFLDETARDDAKLRRMRGWGKGKARVECRSLHTHGSHISILALYGLSGFISHDWKKGAYKAHDFMAAFETMVVPHLGQYPGPNSILVLDNCTIHHSYEQELVSLVHSVGAEVIFLAPYSPIDNPIEFAFGVMKSYWARHQAYLSTFPINEAVEIALASCYADPEKSAANTYSHCGYP